MSARRRRARRRVGPNGATHRGQTVDGGFAGDRAACAYHQYLALLAVRHRDRVRVDPRGRRGERGRRGRARHGAARESGVVVRCTGARQGLLMRPSDKTVDKAGVSKEWLNVVQGKQASKQASKHPLLPDHPSHRRMHRSLAHPLVVGTSALEWEIPKRRWDIHKRGSRRGARAILICRLPFISNRPHPGSRYSDHVPV